MTASVVTALAARLDRELRSRGLRLPLADCAHILRIVITDTAIAGATEFLQPDPPPVRPLDGGCMSPGVASAVALSSAEREAMAARFDRADQCRLRIPHDDGCMHREDLIAGEGLTALAAMIRGAMADHPQFPSSATPAPSRTSDGGRAPSGDAPAVKPAPEQADRARGIIMAARAEEREMCATVCDRWIRSKNLFESLAATAIAKAIRALPLTAGCAGEPIVILPDERPWTAYLDGAGEP